MIPIAHGSVPSNGESEKHRVCYFLAMQFRCSIEKCDLTRRGILHDDHPSIHLDFLPMIVLPLRR